MIWLWVKFILLWSLIFSGITLLVWFVILCLETWRYKRAINRRVEKIDFEMAKRRERGGSS